MTKKHLYPSKLEEFIRDGHLYIPRKIQYDEHLRLYKRYWIDGTDTYFKVDQIYLIDQSEYYSVRYIDSMMGTFSYPPNYDYTYELLIDKNNIAGTEDLSEIEKSLTGAEIKFWFFIHNIEFEEKYKSFWSFLDPTSKCLISDNKSYFIYIDKYGNFKVKLDTRKENNKRRRNNVRNYRNGI